MSTIRVAVGKSAQYTDFQGKVYAAIVTKDHGDGTFQLFVLNKALFTKSLDKPVSVEKAEDEESESLNSNSNADAGRVLKGDENPDPNHEVNVSDHQHDVDPEDDAEDVTPFVDHVPQMDHVSDGRFNNFPDAGHSFRIAF